MKKFRFRFQTVENVKKRQEDQKRERLAEANHTLHGKEAQLAGLNTMRDACERQIVTRTTGRLNAAELVLSHIYLQKLTRDIRRQKQEVTRAQQEVETRRTTLLETAQERKMFESLRARDRASYMYEEARQEQATMDEIASRIRHPSAGRGHPRKGRNEKAGG